MTGIDEYQDSQADIQYLGIAGTTADCKHAIIQLIQGRAEIANARILTVGSYHGFLFTIGEGDLIAIKFGFGSGYLGEGSHGFAFVLQLLEAYLPPQRLTNSGSENSIDEFMVSKEIMQRLDNSALMESDIEKIKKIRPVRPNRWYDYIYAIYKPVAGEDRCILKGIQPVIPLGIIDARIADLAVTFWSDPDGKILTGYRRLEDMIRNRIKSRESNTKLLGAAFSPNDGRLTWENLDGGEVQGRYNFIIGAYMAFRNPRAHREPGKEDEIEQVSQFLMLNQSFLFEESAVERVDGESN